MLTRRVFPALAAVLAVLPLAGWLAFAPPACAAEAVLWPDPAGVTVDLGGATILHRPPIAYSQQLRARNIQGAVVAEVTLDANGVVTDARILGGPEELRGIVLKSVLDWHFLHATGARQITVTFQASGTGGPAPLHSFSPIVHLAGPAPAQGALKKILTFGLSEQAQTELLGRLPVHEGDTITVADAEPRIAEAVKAFDAHLSVRFGKTTDDGITLGIIGWPVLQPTHAAGAPGGAISGGAIHSSAASSGAPAIRVGGAVQQAKLISQPRPVYPPDAKVAHIQGAVHLEAVIAADGKVKRLEVLSGHPMLVAAALEAVQQWVYEPTLLNGAPVEVITGIDVNFALMEP
jgi:TonB family protein